MSPVFQVAAAVGVFVAVPVFVLAGEAFAGWLDDRRFRRENPGVLTGSRHGMPPRTERINKAAATGQREIWQAYHRALQRMERAQ